MDNIPRNTMLLAGVVLLDQTLKWLVQAASADFDLGFLRIHEARNTGASFGILQGNNTALLFIGLMALGVIMLSVKRIKEEHELPVALISGGIIGNLIDRMFRGYVVDFLDLKWWPSFNIADSAICIGVTWLIILIWNDSEDGRNKEGSAGKIRKKAKGKKGID